MKKSICKDDLDYHLYLKKANYTNNNRIYLGLDWYDENNNEFDTWGDITINLSDYLVEDDNIIAFISGDLPRDVYNQLIRVGLLTEIDTVQYNLGRYKKCLINEDIVKEYTEE